MKTRVCKNGNIHVRWERGVDEHYGDNLDNEVMVGQLVDSGVFDYAHDMYGEEPYGATLYSEKTVLFYWVPWSDADPYFEGRRVILEPLPWDSGMYADYMKRKEMGIV